MINLKEQLLLHKEWLKCNTKGKKLEFKFADLRGEELSGADLREAYFVCTHLNGANLTGANLKGTNLKFTDLSEADLKFIDLSVANLSYANLTGVNITGANIKGTNLNGTNLSRANLSNANLSRANLTEANLTEANLNGADLRYCIGNNKEVKSLQIGTYLISYTKDILNIGCQSHTLDKWKNFSDDDILSMDGEKALEWWRLNKDIIITLVSREQL